MTLTLVYVCVDGVCLTCQTYLASLGFPASAANMHTILLLELNFSQSGSGLKDPACAGSFIPYAFSGRRQKKPRKTEQTKWKSGSFGMMTVSRPQHALTRFNAQWYCMECSDVYNVIQHIQYVVSNPCDAKRFLFQIELN